MGIGWMAGRKMLLSGWLMGLWMGLMGAEGVDGTRLTVERIFGEGHEFKSEVWGPARWLRDSTGYLTLEGAGGDVKEEGGSIREIVKYGVERGEREVVVAAASLIPRGESRPLSIVDYAWSKDYSKVLLFTNTRRVWRKETRGDYWVLDVGSGELRKLGGKAAEATLMFATFSPDGGRVAYVSGNNLYVQTLKDYRIRQLTTDGTATVINGTADWVNEEEFGLRNGLRWSPDGEYIAYWQFDTSGVGEMRLINNTEQLYPQVTTYAYPKVGGRNSACRVGVVKASGGRTRWFRGNGDMRNQYVARMEWAPDSSRVVFQRLNRMQNTNEVVSGDPRSGKTEVCFTDRDEAWVEVMDEMHWVEGGGGFLWLSERDGWQHLYVVSVGDRKPRLLTPGAFDVISVAGVDESRGMVYFVASPDNPTQRHLYGALLDGSGEVRRLSPLEQEGTHSYEISGDGRWAFHTFSRFGEPPVIDLVELPGHRVIRRLAGNEELRGKVGLLKASVAEFFRVNISNGPPLDAWCIRPPDFDPGRRYPLLIHVYGEPAGSTVVDRWGGETYLWHRMLAERGYVVVSVDNRGMAAPRGREWRKSVYGQIGILASADQAAATREILGGRGYLDPGRVGIWGWSGGGSMSLNAIFRYPDLYQMAMAIAFVSDQRFYDTIYQERYMGLPAGNEAGFKEGSPITHAGGLKGDLLLVYGTGDDNCHYQNFEVLVNELIRRNKQFDQMSYPNRTHAIQEGENTKRHLFETLTRYLEEKLPVGP
jgi:dipeptidyl-peptidase-4